VRILGADLPREPRDDESPEQTIVMLDDAGRLAKAQHVASLPALAAEVGRLVGGGEPFLLGVNVPVVVPPKQARVRPVESLVRRRLGFRMPAGGRAARSGEPHGIAGETLMAGLAAAGQPCLPYPDRDRRQPGLAETHPALILKSLLWESSPLASAHEQGERERLFRAYEPPGYRPAPGRSRSGWAERAANMDLILRALGTVDGFDFDQTRELLCRAESDRDVERAAGIFDATLIAGTARRYLESPETCLFLGDRERGYVILPADGLVRRLALASTAAPAGQLFPQASLRERLGPHSRLRSVELLSVPGRPQRTEASFKDLPRYEFDNLDEMLWWKHCRHLAGPSLPTEGLHELVVLIGSDPENATPLKLQRSRHQTLSFRFEPPAAWRARVTTRDGRTYAFRVLRAVYETLPAAD
jgi:predicted RNase H-like nuclease